MNIESKSLNQNLIGHTGKKQLIARFVDVIQELPMQDIAALLAYANSCSERASATRRAIPDNTKLTEREQEVLVLVAHGYSRRAIGQSLSISMNTAARHIANIYAKLGVSTVAEATQWAYSRRLIAAPQIENSGGASYMQL